MVRTTVTAGCKENARHGGYGVSKPWNLVMYLLVVEFIFEGRKCRLHVPVPNLSVWKLKLLAFKAFTDISDPSFIFPAEVAGTFFEMI
jgi:hypothetical protein